MEKLIEFLLDNIYIVIVIAGFVLSAMGKRKGKGGGRTVRMPDFGGGDASAEQPEVLQRHMPRSEESKAPGWQPTPERRMPHAARRAVSSGMPPAVHQRTEAPDESYLSENLQKAKASSARTAENLTARPAAAPAAARSPRAAAELDASAMRQAVLWAEIVGPPRAKRPWNKSRDV